MLAPKSNKSLRKRRASELTGISGTWIQIGERLSQVESEGLWIGHAPSFSGWLKSQADQHNAVESNFWRYMMSVRFYTELSDVLRKQKVACPTLDSLSEKVSAENLELLSKLMRAMPQEQFSEIAVRVLERTVTRQELRKLWQTYRSVLDGRTARGRGVSRPLVDLKNPQEMARITAAKIETLVSAAPENWTGHDNPVFVKAIPEIRLRDLFPSFGNSEIDIVVAIKPSRDDSVEIHGVEVQLRFHSRLVQKLEELSHAVDYLWIVSDKKLSLAQLKVLPQKIGVMTVVNGVIEVTRNAVKTGAPTEAILAMTQYFLQKALAR